MTGDKSIKYNDNKKGEYRMGSKILDPNTIILLSVIKKELNKATITRTLKKEIEELEEKITQTAT